MAHPEMSRKFTPESRKRLSDAAKKMWEEVRAGKRSQPYKKRKYSDGICIVCKKAAARVNSSGKYCSEECRSVVNRARGRDQYLTKTYGITQSTVEKMLESQGGRCAICPKTEPGGKQGKWHVDHDHKTGKVRGLLCAGCNLALGVFKDDKEMLKNAIKYLETWEG